MEEEIGRLRKGIVTFCNHLESSCDALKQSLSRRPIPLDSATSTFTEILKRRISSTSVELNILETMSLGTVSLEELLGHCYEVFNSNNSLLLRLHSHLADLSLEDTESEGEKDIVALKVGMGSEDDLVSELHIPSSLPSADPLMDDSLSLKSMGLSDVCLATLASEANVKTEGNDSFLREPAIAYHPGRLYSAAKNPRIIPNLVARKHTMTRAMDDLEKRIEAMAAESQKQRDYLQQLMERRVEELSREMTRKLELVETLCLNLKGKQVESLIQGEPGLSRSSSEPAAVEDNSGMGSQSFTSVTLRIEIKVEDEFNNLAQRSGVREYADKFEEWRARMLKENKYLSERYFTLSFLSGLQEELKDWVRTKKPQTLSDAYEQALLHEQVLRRKTKNKSGLSSWQTPIREITGIKSINPGSRLGDDSKNRETRSYQDLVCYRYRGERVLDFDVLIFWKLSSFQRNKWEWYNTRASIIIWDPGPVDIEGELDVTKVQYMRDESKTWDPGDFNKLMVTLELSAGGGEEWKLLCIGFFS